VQYCRSGLMLRGAYIIRVIITLMMEAVNMSEMSVYFYETTWYNIPEGCHVHIHCHEDLKSD